MTNLVGWHAGRLNAIANFASKNVAAVQEKRGVLIQQDAFYPGYSVKEDKEE